MDSFPPEAGDDLPGRVDFDAESFSGVVRLFPLPSPALFPRLMLPLHVFEERYREMVEDALAGDELIAMAVLKPGWEPDYASRPPIEEHACLGKIVAHHRAADGRYHLLVAGVSRLCLGDEITPPRSFRRASAELLTELTPSPDDRIAQELRERLAGAFADTLPMGPPPEPLRRVFDPATPIGLLADVAAFTLPLPREVKQAVLAEPNGVARSRVVLAAIDAGRVSDDPPGPSPFSLN